MIDSIRYAAVLFDYDGVAVALGRLGDLQVSAACGAGVLALVCDRLKAVVAIRAAEEFVIQIVTAFITIGASAYLFR
jgi:hypothetical protein